MKIAIITDSIRDKSTGIGYYAREVINELLSQDNKNRYFFLDYMETEFNKDKLITIYNPFKIIKTYLWHNYLPYKTRKLALDYIFNFSATPHLTHYNEKEIFFVYDISWYLYPEYHRLGRVFYHRLAFKTSLKNSYKIVVDSINTGQDLINIFNVPTSKIHVIYPVYKPTHYHVNASPLKNKFPYILFVGTLEPRKNVESIIKAFYEIRKTSKIKYKLVICGKKGWMYKNIFELIKQLRLENDIVYMGYITDEDKSYLYQHADCFVYPSFYEGFGIPVLEAMSYGCPVVTSNVSSLPEVAGQAGIQVDPYKLEDLINAIRKIINNKKTRDSMRLEGYNQVKKLSNTNPIEKLLNSLK